MRVCFGAKKYPKKQENVTSTVIETILVCPYSCSTVISAFFIIAFYRT